jgi:hypothetical protein
MGMPRLRVHFPSPIGRCTRSMRLRFNRDDQFSDPEVAERPPHREAFLVWLRETEMI